MLKRYAAMFLVILILLNFPISTNAVEVIIGDDVYIVDNDVDLDHSVEINATSYDTDGVLDRIAEGEQNQFVEDFVAAMLIVDAFQHNDFLNSSELKVEKLLRIIPYVTGMEHTEVEKNGNVQKI